jgi:hypothetical protein
LLVVKQTFDGDSNRPYYIGLVKGQVAQVHGEYPWHWKQVEGAIAAAKNSP